ncbi:DUF1015 domain-containing protein [Spinactinospora alkalitolerans]
MRYAASDARALIDSPALNLAPALAPPYDVLDADTVTDLMRAEPRNAVRLTLPPAARESRGFPADLSGPDRYRRAAHTLRRWIADGVLVQDPEPVLYVYEQTAPDGRRQRGLIGALRLPGPGSAAVRPHEDVLPGPVADRARLMAATRANLEPIFLLYRGGAGGERGAAGLAVDEAAATTTAALVDTVTGDGVTHRLWAIADPGVQAAVAADLAGRTALIADGHHRYAAYLRLRAEAGAQPDGPWEHGLAFLVDSDASPPRLGAIHRVLPGLAPDAAAQSARKVAEVEEFTAPETASAIRRLHAAAAQGPALLLAGGGSWYLLRGFSDEDVAEAAPERSAPWRALPTAVLSHLLMPLWGATDEGARLVHDDAAEAVTAARSCGGTAVIVPPLSVADVYAVTARGELTPRKSTSFGPKPRTGLVLRAFR